MKKIFTNTVIALVIVSSLSSCATVFGGRVTQAQRTKPKPGEPSRAIRPVALIADILLFWPGIIVDFATGAIYRPERKDAVKAPEAKEVAKSETTDK